MNREEALHRTLDALEQVQVNVALILEAKALEAEKARNWLLSHMLPEALDSHQRLLSTSLNFHAQNVEIIEGIAKMCVGLNRSMKEILQPAGSGTDDLSIFYGGDSFGDGKHAGDKK